MYNNCGRLIDSGETQHYEYYLVNYQISPKIVYRGNRRYSYLVGIEEPISIRAKSRGWIYVSCDIEIPKNILDEYLDWWNYSGGDASTDPLRHFISNMPNNSHSAKYIHSLTVSCDHTLVCICGVSGHFPVETDSGQHLCPKEIDLNKTKLLMTNDGQLILNIYTSEGYKTCLAQ